ncbi:MAG TPA: Rieske (2Fe-2S) protein, partial [Arthrobacter sp.]
GFRVQEKTGPMQKMKAAKGQAPTAKKPDQSSAPVSRRGFLTILWAALGLAALAEFVWLAFSFLRPEKWDGAEGQAGAVVPAGSLASCEPGTVTAFQKGEFYLVRLNDGGLLALSCKCTHLGCTVPWVEKEKKFICPCHASAFDITGSVIGPPAARALDMFRVTVENNVVLVDTGKRTRRSGFEPGQAVYPGKG